MHHSSLPVALVALTATLSALPGVAQPPATAQPPGQATEWAAPFPQAPALTTTTTPRGRTAPIPAASQVPVWRSVPSTATPALAPAWVETPAAVGPAPSWSTSSQRQGDLPLWRQPDQQPSP